MSKNNKKTKLDNIFKNIKMKKTSALIFGISSVWLLWKLHSTGIINLPLLSSEPKPKPKSNVISVILLLSIITISFYITTETEQIIRRCQQYIPDINIDCCFKANMNKHDNKHNDKPLINDQISNLNDIDDDIITSTYEETYHFKNPKYDDLNLNAKNVKITTDSLKNENKNVIIYKILTEDELDKNIQDILSRENNNSDNDEDVPKIKINKINKITETKAKKVNYWKQKQKNHKKHGNKLLCKDNNYCANECNNNINECDSIDTDSNNNELKLE